MDSPVCFTQYFVDKQNVRSYGNIFKLSLLKEGNNELFLRSIFGTNVSFSQLSSDIFEVLSDLGTNLRNYSKQDFKYFFPYDDILYLHSLNKGEIYEKCWNALSKIVPKTLFGNRHNEDTFKKVVAMIIHGMKRQHIQFGKKIKVWNLCVKPWNTLPEAISEEFLNIILKWIIKNILSAMITLNFHVTTCKFDADENKLHYFYKHQWQSFYDKSLHKMLQQGVIKKVEPYCLGHKIKRNHNIKKKLKLRVVYKDIPKLHLILKSNNDFRPIIRYKNNTNLPAMKHKLRDRLKLLRLLTNNSHKKMKNEYNELYFKWIRLNNPKLYFVKSDLSNAFGCVNKSKLMMLLNERFLNYKHSESNTDLLERNSRVFKDLVTELQNPIFIKAGSSIFSWKKGLVQGYKYSPALSELYYNHLDSMYFENCLTNTNGLRFFTRVVDDYLYITDAIEDAQLFLNSLSNYENVNYEKTIANFAYKDVKVQDDITFLGYCYNTANLQVRRAHNVFTGQMCYKISLSYTIENIYRFIESRIGQSSIQINSHIFNFLYNNEELVWEHIFTTFCLSANKFCTILALLCEGTEMQRFLHLYKKKVTVKLGNSIIEVLERNKTKEYLFVYCINHFRYISWLALSLCAKGTPKCLKIVPLVNDELAKSNCIFGKWREHASRIDNNGDCLKKAVKEVCRRPDLRVIMKRFGTLPKGFECYNNKLINK